MTATVNGHRHEAPSVTVGADVHMRVRASENPTQAAPSPDPASKSAYTRAIPQETDSDQSKSIAAVRDFVSLHGGAAKAAAATSWFGREQPECLYDVAGDVFPAKGEAVNWVRWVALSTSGVLRLTLLAACYLAAFCVATRIRATATTLIVATAVTAHNVLS